LFESVGYDFSQKHEVEEIISKETSARMIEELEFQNTPAARLLIDQLKHKNNL
jgi:hypothetical protein